MSTDQTPTDAAQAAPTPRSRRRKAAAEEPSAPAGAVVFDPPAQLASGVAHEAGRADHGVGMPRDPHPSSYGPGEADEWRRGWDAAQAAAQAGQQPEADPLDALADEPAAPAQPADLAPEILVQIRGLWANGREIAAIRLYRDQFSPQPDLADAKRAVEALVADGEAPADFVLPEGGPALDEAPAAAPDAVLEDAPPLEGGAVPQAQREPPPRRTGRHEITRRTQDRAVPLTDEEFEAKAHELAVMQDKITEMEARHTAEKKTMREEKAAAEGRRSALALVVRDKVEVRRVEVVIEADYDAGVAYEIDAATGRVLSRRAIGPAEAQVPLFGAGPQAAPTAQPPAPDQAPGEQWDDEQDEGAEPADADEEPESEQDDSDPDEE